MIREGSRNNGHDSSALVALLLLEAEVERLARAIAADHRRLVSVFNWLETAIVIEAKKGEAGARELDLLLHRAQIEIVAMNPDQSEIARTGCAGYSDSIEFIGHDSYLSPVQQKIQFASDGLSFFGFDHDSRFQPIKHADRTSEISGNHLANRSTSSSRSKRATNADESMTTIPEPLSDHSPGFDGESGGPGREGDCSVQRSHHFSGKIHGSPLPLHPFQAASIGPNDGLSNGLPAL